MNTEEETRMAFTNKYMAVTGCSYPEAIHEFNNCEIDYSIPSDTRAYKHAKSKGSLLEKYK